MISHESQLLLCMEGEYEVAYYSRCAVPVYSRLFSVRDSDCL